MKRENLYLVGGALLASTALTTAATAATLTMVPGAYNSTATTVKLSAQSFGATPATTDKIGPAGLLVRLSGPLAATFTATVSVTGAKFSAGTLTSADVVPLSFVTFAGTGSGNGLGTTVGAASSTLVSSMGCAVAFSADTLVLASCNPVQASFASIGGFAISGISFDNATAMATAGSTISLGSVIQVGGANLDTTSAQPVVTSTNSVGATITAPTLGSLNVSASPAFANFATNQLSASIATVNVTMVGTVARDLRTTITNTLAIGDTNSIQVNSTIFNDDALNRTEISTVASLTASPTLFTGGFVTFGAITAARLFAPFDIKVEFNGTAAIDAASAGTLTLTYSALSGGNSANASAPAAASGSVSSVARAGLNIDINGMQPGTAQGSRTYTSLLRIANSGSVAGTVQIVLRNENTGATLGTYTSPSIPAGASLQISSANIEAGAGVTAVASIGYRASISGNINGYVQHVNWNQDAGFFSDLSSSRTGSTTATAGK